MRNKIEGVNRGRGESLETIHHLYIAQRKGYLSQEAYEAYHDRYHECVRMLNGLERTLERQSEDISRRWPISPASPPES